jgi:Bacteriocin-protection, YdeI or OmpD-Associated
MLIATGEPASTRGEKAGNGVGTEKPCHDHADAKQPDENRSKGSGLFTAPGETRPSRAHQRAYQGGQSMTIPPDLQAAIDAEPEAKAMLATLSAQNRDALAFRVHNMKTEAGRKKKIEGFVQMLKRGQTIYPQKKS